MESLQIPENLGCHYPSQAKLCITGKPLDASNFT